MGLTEDNLLLLAMERSPAADAPFQRAPDPDAEIGMAAQHLLEHRDRPQAWCFPQQRYDLGVENIGQRIGAPPTPDACLLRWQSRIVRKPISRRRTEPGLGRRYGNAITVLEFHIEPHLMIVDVTTGHPGLPL